MYGARMIARQCITVSGVKTELLLSVTIVVNGEEGGVGTLGSESFPTCLPLRLASRGPCEVLSYLLDKFRERFSNGAVTGPPHKQNKTTKHYVTGILSEQTSIYNSALWRGESVKYRLLA